MMADYIVTIEGDRIVKATEVVRCGECGYHNGDYCHCNHGFAHGGHTFFVHSDDFCKYGERRADE